MIEKVKNNKASDHPSNIGKWDGWKGHLPTEEYLSNPEYQKAYFEGVKQHYLAQEGA